MSNTAHQRISIHAPREGSDINKELKQMGIDAISIHAPREGSDSKLVQIKLSILDNIQ